MRVVVVVVAVSRGMQITNPWIIHISIVAPGFTGLIIESVDSVWNGADSQQAKCKNFHDVNMATLL